MQIGPFIEPCGLKIAFDDIATQEIDNKKKI